MRRNYKTAISKIGEPERHQSSMREFDALPATMRQVLADAPFDFATHGAMLLVQERGLEEALIVAKRNIPKFIERAATQDYGPAHPQARRRTVGETVDGTEPK